MNNIVLLVGRVLLASLFVVMGIYKVSASQFTIGVMAGVGLPAFLFPLVVVLEVGGGMLLIVGWLTKSIALIFAIFCVTTAVLFHNDFSQLAEMISFLKNMSVAGGMLYVFQHGPGAISVDFVLVRSSRDARVSE